MIGTASGSLDETLGTPTPVGNVYRRLLSHFRTGDIPDIRRSIDLSQRLTEDLSAAPTSLRSSPDRRRIPFDLFPRVIGPAEWIGLEAGIRQRASIWNHFLRDIHDSQEVLKAGIIPFELVYDSPDYLRPAVGIKVPDDVFCHFCAFDLARDAQGRWTVIEDHVSTPKGAVYALHARNVINGAAAGLMEFADIQAHRNFATDMLEHFRGFSRGGSTEPRVVMLSSGPDSPDYFEHGHLARLMGVPLVRGDDLTVLNTSIHLKTIGGLEPIDVVFRRIEDSQLDPLTLDPESPYGIPALLSCVRKRTTSVVNAIGAGVASNRVIASMLNRLSKFYLNEPLLLPTVERYALRDPDGREAALSRLESCFVAPVHARPDESRWLADELSDGEMETLRRTIMAAPSSFVAEPLLPRDPLPCFNAGGLEERHSGLRVFALSGRKTRVLPCALTRFAADAKTRSISLGRGGGLKDTWILHGPKESDSPARTIIIQSPERRLRLGSRIADRLLWLGRYAERAENATRLLRVIDQINAETEGRQTHSLDAFLRATLEKTTGHRIARPRGRRGIDLRPALTTLLLDAKNPASVAGCIRACRDNILAIRESTPPELWRVIDRIHQIVETANVGAAPGRVAIVDIQGLTQELLAQFDALSGAAGRHMLRDDGWHFWSLGCHLERALVTVLVSREAVQPRSQNRNGAERQVEEIADCLLRLLACQYAYRSLFQSRPNLCNVTTLILQDGHLPRGLRYCMDEILSSLRSVLAGRAEDTASAPLRMASKLAADIEFTDLDEFFPTGPNEPDRRLGRLADSICERLSQLSSTISDHYLHHQAFNILR